MATENIIINFVGFFPVKECSVLLSFNSLLVKICLCKCSGGEVYRMSNECQSYEIFFGFTRDPFSFEYELDLFYLTDRVKAFLVDLYQQVRNNSAFAVVYGDGGLGKSMLAKKVISDLRMVYDSVYIVAVDCPSFGWEAKDFLIAILKEDGIEVDEGQSFQSMVELWLVKLVEKRGVSRVLVVDNAHNLRSRNALELLRTFNSLRIREEVLVNVVLFAEPKWEVCIGELEGFKELFTLRLVLEPLTKEELQSFIRLRLERSGYDELDGPVFDEPAYIALSACTQGNPKKVLQLLRRVFTELASRGRKVIDSRVVLECIEREFHLTSADRMRIAKALLEYDVSAERREEINKLPTKELERWHRDVKSVEILLREYEGGGEEKDRNV